MLVRRRAWVRLLTALCAVLFSVTACIDLRPADPAEETSSPAETEKPQPQTEPETTPAADPTPETQKNEGLFSWETAETEPAAPESTAPETEKPPFETDASDDTFVIILADETEAPETEKPETAAPASEPETTASAPEVEIPVSQIATPGVSEGSLAPFGTISWRFENGKYVYDFPARNTAGMATLDEMNTFPTTPFEDAGEGNGWYFGPVSYDEATGTVTYSWAAPGSTADRRASTMATLRKYGAIYRGDETRKAVYLTFDCGYEYGLTGQILDTLKEKQAPAAFFVTGPYVRNEAELVGRMLDEGHVVGSHTNTHPNMTTLTADQVVDEMKQVEDALKAAYPNSPDLLYFRPPEGAANEWLLRIEAKLGYRTVFWSYAHRDWVVDDQPDVATALAKAEGCLHPGCVFLLHAQSSTNAAMLGDLIDYIRAQGYEILPLCEIGA